MFTVAIIGPDGAGKTTIARRLDRDLGCKARYVYMGVNLEASNWVLPTTWALLALKRLRGRRPDMAGPPDPRRRAARPPGLRGLAARVKAALRTANLIAEATFRQVLVWFHRRRGYVVLMDRDFFVDYYAHDVCPTQALPPSRRLHGWFLRRWYRRPDLVVLLDAPGELLWQRKKEGTVELLETRRREYQSLGQAVRELRSVDATQPLDAVVADVAQCILNFQQVHFPQGKPTHESAVS